MVEDKNKFKETFLDVGALIVLVALPASAGIAVIADPLVRVLLGEKWLETVPVLSILAISAAFVAASGNNGVAHLALGYPKLLTLQSFLRLVVLVVLSVGLAPAYGIVGVAIAELCGAAVNLLAGYPVVFRHLSISAGEYGERIWRPVAGTAGMAVVVWVVEDLMGVGHDVASALLRLSTGVGVGAATYVILIMAMWWLCGKPDGAERILLNRMVEVIRTIRRSPTA
jgi:O-antigen/teichoic acid export membrane protein